MITKSSKAHWWSVVAGCLFFFHQFPKGKALRVTLKRRNDMERECANRPFKDLIYHDEPFNSACRIARQDLSEVDCWEAYQPIWDAKDPFETALRLPGRYKLEDATARLRFREGSVKPPSAAKRITPGRKTPTASKATEKRKRGTAAATATSKVKTRLTKPRKKSAV